MDAGAHFVRPGVRQVPRKVASVSAAGGLANCRAAPAVPPYASTDPRVYFFRGRSIVMAARPKPHATGKTKPGDLSERVGAEQIRSRGVNVDQLLEKLIDDTGSDVTTSHHHTIPRTY